jgi:hypothetical protein
LQNRLGDPLGVGGVALHEWVSIFVLFRPWWARTVG